MTRDLKADASFKLLFPGHDFNDFSVFFCNVYDLGKGTESFENKSAFGFIFENDKKETSFIVYKSKLSPFPHRECLKVTNKISGKYKTYKLVETDLPSFNFYQKDGKSCSWMFQYCYEGYESNSLSFSLPALYKTEGNKLIWIEFRFVDFNIRFFFDTDFNIFRISYIYRDKAVDYSFGEVSEEDYVSFLLKANDKLIGSKSVLDESFFFPDIYHICDYLLEKKDLDLERNYEEEKKMFELSLEHWKSFDVSWPRLPLVKIDNDRIYFFGDYEVMTEYIVKALLEPYDFSYSCFENKKYIVVVPPSVRKIGRNAFCNVPLKTVELPDQIKTIENQAFYDCSMTEIKLPKSLKKIGDRAFELNRFESIFIPATVESIGKNAFGNKLFCPFKSISVDPNNNTYDSREGCNAIVETATRKPVFVAECSNIPSSIPIGSSLYQEWIAVFNEKNGKMDASENDDLPF